MEGRSSPTVLPDLDRDEYEADYIESVRPALTNLSQEQQAALDDFRDNGLLDRPALLQWLLKLQYRTLGRLPDYWFTHVSTDPSALAVVLTGPHRGEYGAKKETRITPEEAWQMRRKLVAVYLRPAARDAFRELRTKAVEYTDGNRPDPEKMAAFAMRPALEEHYQRQREALRAFTEGFDSELALDRWCHELDLATFGAIKRIEPRFDALIQNEPLAPDLYLSDESRYVNTREAIAARFLLPATNVAVRQVALTSGEASNEKREKTTGVEV